MEWKSFISNVVFIALYRKIVSYVLLRSGLGSPTDIGVVREATGKWFVGWINGLGYTCTIHMWYMCVYTCTLCNVHKNGNKLTY